jgi:hypothetical protein
MKEPNSKNPWDWMQPHDVKRWGEVIMDPVEQQRWCRAVMLGGLPYMWRVKAATVRELAYEKLQLLQGDKVFIIGESIESCGFIDDIRERIGPDGEIKVVDITDEARDSYMAGKVGKHGQLATWHWDYTGEFPDGYFDCVAVLQAVQHTEDWHDAGTELLRIMKKGRNMVLAEITFSPRMVTLAQLDIHLEYWMEKIFARVGWDPTEFPYYSAKDLHSALDELLVNTQDLNWKGVELFWGTKR